VAPPGSGARVPREFYARDTVEVARELLGKLVVVPGAAPRRRGRIVETEAYDGPRDQASHAFRGPTPRNAPMFGEPGHAYVYLIYGMWNCLNLVTREPGHPSAVLLRALDFEGLDEAAGSDPRAGAGPGKLCAALGVDRSFTGEDVVDGKVIWLEDDGCVVPARQIARGPRVNVDYAGTWAKRPWRFWWKGHPAVSR
jgi:DNA-3-methyladenine glycosylase